MTDPEGGTNARRAAREQASRSGGRAKKGNGGGGPRRARGAASGPPRRRAGATLDPDALAALEEERDFLLRSLDDLEREHDAGDVDDVDYAELKDDYTARAAAVLRAIDDRRALASQSRPSRSWLRLVAVLAFVAVAAGVGGRAARPHLLRTARPAGRSPARRRPTAATSSTRPRPSPGRPPPR